MSDLFADGSETVHQLALIRDNTVVNVCVCNPAKPDLVWLGVILGRHDEAIDLGPEPVADPVAIGWTRTAPDQPFTAPADDS